MARIAGVDIPDKKRTEIALTYIYGIGRSNVQHIIDEANIDPNKRASELTGEEISRIARVLERFNVEGNLKKQVHENVERLKRIGSYKGMRHAAGLPAHGQRTRTNARTRRGRRKTVGAVNKEDGK